MTTAIQSFEGSFLEIPEFDMDSLLLTWQEAVFDLYLAEGKIEPDVIENMLTWKHTGFSIDQSGYLPAGDKAGIERLVQYITRCPFSLSRLVKVTDTGQIVYKAEKQPCRAFPGHNGDGIASGPKRNFQVLGPLDFIAEFTQHIPPKGSHLIRYYGFYSNKARGMRKKAEAQIGDPAVENEASDTPAPRCNRTWTILIKRVYEVDPLACPKCGGIMKVVAFIEPPQAEVIEKILKHCGLWQEPVCRPPPNTDGLARELDFGYTVGMDRHPEPDQTQDLIYEDIDTFLAIF